MRLDAIERTLLCTLLFDGCSEILKYMAPDDFVYYRDVFEDIKKLDKEHKPYHEDFIHQDLLEKVLDIQMQSPVSNWKPYADQLKEENYKKILKSKLSKAIDLISEDDMKQVKEILSNINTPSKKLKVKNFAEIEAKEANFICSEFMPIPKGSVTIISAAGSTGKTWIALHLQNVAAQRGLKSLAWYSEDSAEVLKGRLDAVNKMRYFENNALCDMVDTSAIPVVRKGKEGLFLSDECYELLNTMKQYDLVIIDPLVNFLGSAGENNNDEVTFFLQPFVKVAKDFDIAVVFLHHSKKNSDDGQNKVRGASAITNSARAAYEVERVYKNKKIDIEKKNHRVIKLTKDNLGAYRHFGGFEREITITPDTDYNIQNVKTDDVSYNFDGFK